MLITRRSTISGDINTMEIDVTLEQMCKYSDGALAQVAFPNITADEREFIISGITPEEWERAFGSLKDDNEMGWRQEYADEMREAGFGEDS